MSYIEVESIFVGVSINESPDMRWDGLSTFLVLQFKLTVTFVSCCERERCCSCHSHLTTDKSTLRSAIYIKLTHIRQLKPEKLNIRIHNSKNISLLDCGLFYRSGQWFHSLKSSNLLWFKVKFFYGSKIYGKIHTLYSYYWIWSILFLESRNINRNNKHQRIIIFLFKLWKLCSLLTAINAKYDLL